MGKNHRHKKHLKSEKAKVKLKQSKTKFLPKGLNVTNINFKIKPIVLIEQLKQKATDVPLSKRKLDIKDLLNRLRHYNENVRYSACDELGEMMKIYTEEIINHHLGEIILNVSSLMQDREQKVRKIAVKAINTILEFTPEAKVEPFFKYLSTNLCCTMTNIDKNIQEDSLLFLDSLLKYSPALISKISEKLLPNFFTLISKLRSDSNLGRMLTVNLNSQMTSVTWRIRVLSRLHAVLESTLSNSVSGDESEKENTVLNDEASIILSCIMNTLHLLWKYVRKVESESLNIRNVFLSEEGKKFLNHLLTNFPYCGGGRNTKQEKRNKNKILETNHDPKCVKENLLICYMFCVLNVNDSHRSLKIEINAITSYLTRCLLTKKYIDYNSTGILIEFLNNCLVDELEAWKRTGADLTKILESTITYYNHNVNNKCKLEIFNILMSVSDLPYFNKCPVYNDWLSSLPNILCRPKINDVLVDALLRLSRKNVDVFQQALLNNLPLILDNLGTLKIDVTVPSPCNNEETVKRNLVNTLFFVPFLDKVHLEAILKFMVKNVESNYYKYFIEMLRLRMDLKSDKTLENLLFLIENKRHLAF